MTKSPFIRVFALVTLALWGFAGVASYVLDPYAIFEPDHTRQVFRHKPAIYLHSRFARPLHLIGHPADIILMGSSRVRDGLDPYYVAGKCACRVENFGISGLRIFEAEAFFRHIVQVSKPRVVVIGLDFFSFNPSRKFEQGFDPEVLQSKRTLLSTVKALYTPEALVTTLWENLSSSPVYQRADGFRERPQMMQLDLSTVLANEANTFANTPDLWGNLDSVDEGISALHRLMSLAREHDVRVELFFTPIHQALIDKIYAIGKGEIFEHWKRSVAAVADKPVWDFAYKNRITSVAGSEAGRYYFDAGHYQPIVGQSILDRILFDAANESFGKPIQPESSGPRN